MECIINQFFELGDILFIEPIYRHYYNLGYTIIAPVNEQYLWVKDYIPYVKFFNKEDYPYSYETVEQKDDGRLHLPIRFAHPLYRGYEDLHSGERKNWMRDKYLYLDLDIELWRTMQFERKRDREAQLEELLKLPKEFNLVNEHFGGSFEHFPISINNSLPNIYLRKTQNFTLLDWLSVIEKATNIYTVETSIVYLVECFNRGKEWHLYPRFPFLNNTDYMDGILSEKWIKHDIQE